MVHRLPRDLRPFQPGAPISREAGVVGLARRGATDPLRDPRPLLRHLAANLSVASSHTSPSAAGAMSRVRAMSATVEASTHRLFEGPHPSNRPQTTPIRPPEVTPPARFPVMPPPEEAALSPQPTATPSPIVAASCGPGRTPPPSAPWSAPARARWGHRYGWEKEKGKHQKLNRMNSSKAHLVLGLSSGQHLTLALLRGLCGRRAPCAGRTPVAAPSLAKVTHSAEVGAARARTADGTN